MKKLVSLIVLFFLISTLFGVSNFACVFTMINPSARGTAFGNSSGAADIWDTSPLGVWSNPAKLGYHQGLAYGYTHTPWFANIFQEMYHQSSYISIGWNGIGVLLPAPSAHKKWGTVMSYGEQTQIDSLGNVISTFESYEADTKYGFGINLVEFASNFIYKDCLRSINHYGEFSFGYSYDDIYSALAPEGTGVSPYNIKGIGISKFSSYGYLLRLSPFNKQNALGGFFALDLVGSINNINPDKAKITYINESQADYLPWGTHSAFAAKLTISKDILLNSELPPVLDNIFSNLLSIYYSYDGTQYGEETSSNPGEWGCGTEITFFDVFSIRKGRYSDTAGELVGNTSGYGINLNYNNIFQFQYNHSEIPGGELQDTNEMSDYLFRVDLLKAYDLFK